MPKKCSYVSGIYFYHKNVPSILSSTKQYLNSMKLIKIGKQFFQTPVRCQDHLQLRIQALQSDFIA